MKQIGFNIPYLTGSETEYIHDAVARKMLSGNGTYTKKCHEFLSNRLDGSKVLLTSSCTDALEMSALLLSIEQGDEVIMPSYTFVSTANAFVLRGAKIVFVDSRPDHPGIDETKIEELITSKTRVIVPVHYAGVACDMDKILQIARKYNLSVVEDAAQAIDSFYKGVPLGAIGDMGAYSFHETKNVISGESGCLIVKNKDLNARSEIIWEKGTNRSAFWRGEVDKYGWVDVGSSFLPSDLTAAFLYAQLEHLESIQNRRKEIWNIYRNALNSIGHKIGLPFIPEFATNNAHMFYFTCKSEEQRNALLKQLNAQGINAVFHYQSLHNSQFFKPKHDGRILENADKYSSTLVRLPFHLSLTDDQVKYVAEVVVKFFN